MTETARSKSAPLRAVKDATGAPGDDDLALINGYSLVPLTVETAYTRRMYLAHNAIDRDREVLDQGLLDDFARTLPGKGLFVKHPGGFFGDTSPGEGRFYRAEVVKMTFAEARKALREPKLQWAASDTDAYLLEAGFYMVRTGGNADLITKIDAGIAGDVSIGFSASDQTAIKDGDGNTIAYRILGPGEAYEGSLVWLGAQPGARIVKGAESAAFTPDDLKRELDDIKAALGQFGKSLAIKSALADGNLPQLRDFEKFLREAGFSKSQATIIAGRGLGYLLRSESGDGKKELAAALRGFQVPTL